MSDMPQRSISASDASVALVSEADALASGPMELGKQLDHIALRLDKLDYSFKSQHDFLHDNLHKSIEALTQSLDRLIFTKHREHIDVGIGEQNSPVIVRHGEREREMVRIKSKISKTGKTSKACTVQSLVQMQSDVLQELLSAHNVSQRRSDGESGYGPAADCDLSRSPKSLHSVVSVLPPSIPQQSLSLPGLLQCRPEVEVKPPKSSTYSHAAMHDLNETSQTHILGSTSLCSSLDGDAPLDAGSRFILAFPSAYLLLGIPILCVLGLFAACGSVDCRSDGGLRSAVLECIIYGIAAALCARRVKAALFSKNLNLATGRLHAFVAEFKVDWREVSGQEGCKYVCMWLLVVLIMVVARCLGVWWRLSSGPVSWDHHVLPLSLEMMSFLIFVLSSGLLTAAAYTQSHLLLGLDKSLDCWCSHIMAMPDFEEGVRSWNVLQALLKCVGRELASSFLVLQVFGSLCFIFFLVSGIVLMFSDDFETLPLLVEVLSSVPLLFLFCLSLRLCAHGAALTEKCRAIPSFVNQIPTQLIDQDRQYLVRFIEDSSAGFCVRNVKLTQEMVMKQVYVVGALLSATFSALSRLLI